MVAFGLDDVAAHRRTRSEIAAEQVRELAQRHAAGARLGSRTELRELCGVSVGTFNETLRILQSTGEITVRPGPGGGVFAAERSAFARLSRQVQDLSRVQPDLKDVMRIVRVLDPLIVRDAAGFISDEQKAELRERLAQLESSSDGELRDVLLSSLEVYSTIVSIGPDPLLRGFAGTLLKAQIRAMQAVAGKVTPEWTVLVQRHIAGVTALVDAVTAGDAAAATEVRRSHDLVELFDAALVSASLTGQSIGE